MVKMEQEAGFLNREEGYGIFQMKKIPPNGRIPLKSKGSDNGRHFVEEGGLEHN